MTDKVSNEVSRSSSVFTMVVKEPGSCVIYSSYSRYRIIIIIKSWEMHGTYKLTVWLLNPICNM
jgi:hypothetical protein